MKPVKVTGVFDNSKEIQVIKNQAGEKGVQIITPLYTHLNSVVSTVRMNSIKNSFSNNMLSLFTSLEHEFDSDVIDRDLRVRYVDLLQAEFDNSVS